MKQEKEVISNNDKLTYKVSDGINTAKMTVAEGCISCSIDKIE